MSGGLVDDARMRETHAQCEEDGEVAAASLIDTGIGGAEGRTCRLFAASGRGRDQDRQMPAGRSDRSV